MTILNLKTWKRGSQRAPHKPLLMLYAMGRWQQGLRDFPWLQVKEQVGALIEQFGGRAKPNVSDPFIRLQKDGDGQIWVVEGPLVLGKSGNPNIGGLNQHNNVGRFTPEFEQILKDRKSFDQIVSQLLVEHFSDTQYEDLLLACGLSDERVFSYTKRRRNPEFRQAVLDAYHYQCAICSYNLSFRNNIIGLEAAHIQWHNAHGPDQVPNGLALCAIHHKLLDYGAIGFNDHLELIAARGLRGGHLDFFIYQHEGRQITLPRRQAEAPALEYISWQRSQIFKG